MTQRNHRKYSLLTFPGHTLFCHASVSLEMPRTSFATSETLLTLQIYDLFHKATFTTPPAIDTHTHTHTLSLPLHLLLQYFLLASVTTQIIRQALRLEFPELSSVLDCEVYICSEATCLFPTPLPVVSSALVWMSLQLGGWVPSSKKRELLSSTL